MRNILKFALRNRRLSAYLRGVYDEARAGPASSIVPETTIPEADPVKCRVSGFDQDRLNLLVPALALRHVFGGISTALSLFASLGNDFDNLRIILTDQHNFSPEDNPLFSDWSICALDDADGPGRRIIPAGDRYARTLPVGRGDRFIATAWWTAISARHINQWQAEVYGFSEQAKFIYLIQDYEPGFYPWSSRYALAEATYHNPSNVIAVFNTGILRSFFEAEGYRFPHAHTFEPTLNTKLRNQLTNTRETIKEKRLIIYGRPGVVRNAFEIIVMALRIWVGRHPDTMWTFVSAGEVHQPVDLGQGKKLVSLGKLSLDEYATELARASVGVSLMISPHPSYPPLEMAAFGTRVVTNKYKTKNLSNLNPCIISIDSVSPQTVADGIDECMRLLDERCSNYAPPEHSSPEWKYYLESESTFSHLPDHILPMLFDYSVSSYWSTVGETLC